MSTTPMMVMSHGNPMLRAIAPPADGPAPQNTLDYLLAATYPKLFYSSNTTTDDQCSINSYILVSYKQPFPLKPFLKLIRIKQLVMLPKRYKN